MSSPNYFTLVNNTLRLFLIWYKLEYIPAFTVNNFIMINRHVLTAQKIKSASMELLILAFVCENSIKTQYQNQNRQLIARYRSEAIIKYLEHFIQNFNRGGFLIGSSSSNRLLKCVGDSPFLTRREIKNIEFGKSFNIQSGEIIQNMFQERKYRYVPIQPLVSKTVKNLSYKHFTIDKIAFITTIGLSLGLAFGIGYLFAILFQNSERNRLAWNPQNDIVSKNDVIIDVELTE